uniref:Uncharacterized protein n=1 Tax=Steinernema glaseri TaxID=37863 RepID=A0A1I7Y866_9BILA
MERRAQRTCAIQRRPSASSTSSSASSTKENVAGSASKIPVPSRREIRRPPLKIVTTQAPSPSTVKCVSKGVPPRTPRSVCTSSSSSSDSDSPPSSPTWSTGSGRSQRCPCLTRQGTSTMGTESMGITRSRKASVDSPPPSPIYKAPFIVGTASSSSSCYQIHGNVQNLLQTVKVNYPMYHSLVMAVVAAPGGTTNLCEKLIAAFDARIALIEEAMDNLWRLSKKSQNGPIQNQLIAEKFYHLYDEVDRCRQKRWDLSYLTYSLNEKGNAMHLPSNRISQIKLIQKVFACKSL